MTLALFVASCAPLALGSVVVSPTGPGGPGGPTDGGPWQLVGNRVFYDAGPVGVGTSTPGARALFEAVNAGNSILGESTSPTLSRYGVLGITRSTIGQGVLGQATAASGINYGVLGQTASSAGRAVAGTATSPTGITYGGRFEAASTDGRAVFARASALTGAAYGVFATSASSAGVGLFASTTAANGQTISGWFDTASQGGVGVLARHTAPTGVAPAIRGDTSSADDRAIGAEGRVMPTTAGEESAGVKGYNNDRGRRGYGVWGLHAGNGVGVFGSALGNDGTGVYGEGSTFGVRGLATAPTGPSYGLEGYSESDEGTGVNAAVTSPVGTTYGVFANASSISGRGVYGSASADNGSTYGVYGLVRSSSGRGVRGTATSATGATYGVFGDESSSDPNAFAVFANGNLGASGLKPFRIDHPSDPANKYLYHYAAEGPEPQNIYNGVATLGDAGEAWVQLPDYFQEINRDFRYQLTCLGGFAPVYVADEIADNRFRIAGGSPGLRVSWEVKGVRNDLYTRANGAPVETDKTGVEKGRYQHPEFYGLPADRGLDPPPPQPRSATPPAGR